MRQRSSFLLILLCSLLSLASISSAGNDAKCQPWIGDKKPRVFVLTDISNEPDDTMSLIRLLLHSDLYDIQGIVAITSFWLPNATYPDQIQDVVNAYGPVHSNLQTHTHTSFPSAEYLASIISSGPTVYGMEALSALESGGKLADGAQKLIYAVDASDTPLYTQIWGGSNTLASALWHVNRTRSTSDLETFTSKLRVYSISDQDDTGIWIRRNFPDVRYIASRHGFNQYPLATWTGISGGALYEFDAGGPDDHIVSQAWLTENIQIGPLGKHYPDVAYIMEGDSPSMLYSIPNGLGDPEHPDWGSWGGRYTSNPLDGMEQYGDAVDFVTGQNGKLFVSNHATIWRWRDAYQHEFAARMQWTLRANGADSNTTHPPVVVVNGSCTTSALELNVNAGENMTLDASESYSPDENMKLNFTWFHYREPTSSQWSLAEVPQINFTYPSGAGGKIAKFTVPFPEAGSCVDAKDVSLSGVYGATSKCQTYHIVVAAKALTAVNPITRYRRVLLHVQPYSNTTNTKRSWYFTFEERIGNLFSSVATIHEMRWTKGSEQRREL